MAEKRKPRQSNPSTTRVITAGGSVRITPPQPARRGKRSTREQLAEVAVTVTPEPISGFVGFLREHAIVGLAVGFAIATQVQGVVKQLTASFINPLFQLIFPGNTELSARTFTLHFNGHHADFGWGAVLYTVIDLLFVLAIIYFVIRFFRLDKLDKPKK